MGFFDWLLEWLDWWLIEPFMDVIDVLIWFFTFQWWPW